MYRVWQRILIIFLNMLLNSNSCWTWKKKCSHVSLFLVGCMFIVTPNNDEEAWKHQYCRNFWSPWRTTTTEIHNANPSKTANTIVKGKNMHQTESKAWLSVHICPHLEKWSDLGGRFGGNIFQIKIMMRDLLWLRLVHMWCPSTGSPSLISQEC